jgi:hypothetical protein
MENYVAVVPKDLVDLVPIFLKNRKADATELEHALESLDLAKVKELGERIYALGVPYGFRHLTTLGREIQDAAKARNVEALRGSIRAYADYVARVQVDYQ